MTRRSDHNLDVPAVVRRRAEARGAEGRCWLNGLQNLVRDMAQEWGLVLGTPLVGGTAAYVVTARTADGINAVLKLHVPGYDKIADEIKVLSIADGRGYVRLLRHDAARGALLQERLGQRLSQMGLPVARQIAII